MQTQSDLIYTIKILGYTHGILGNIIKKTKNKIKLENFNYSKI